MADKRPKSDYEWREMTSDEFSSPSEPGKNEHPSDSSYVRSEALKTAGVAVASGVAIPKVATAGLSLYGFTKAGVAAGSMAAAAQAAIGNVTSGTLFSVMQALGATGGFAVFGSLGLGAALGGGTSYAFYKWFTGGGDSSKGVEKSSDNVEENEADSNITMMVPDKVTAKADLSATENLITKAWKKLQIEKYNELHKNKSKL